MRPIWTKERLAASQDFLALRAAARHLDALPDGGTEDDLDREVAALMRREAGDVPGPDDLDDLVDDCLEDLAT